MQRSEYFVNKFMEIEKLLKLQTFEQASIIRMMATDLQDVEILTSFWRRRDCHKSRMLDKIKNSLPKFPKKTKDRNNDETVAGYRALEELHPFIGESVIGGFYLLNIKELHPLYG